MNLIGLKFLAILCCLVGQAFFAGMETGVISIERIRLRHLVKQGSRRAGLLQSFLRNPDRLLGTTLVGTNLCVVVISVLCTGMAVQWIGEGGEIISAVAVTLVILIFGEYLPKAWFHSRPLERCRRFAGILRVSEAAFRPISLSIIWLTQFFVPASTRSLAHSRPLATKEDLKVLTKESEEEGVLSSRERFMIHRVFELSGTAARDIMIPRDAITTVETSTTVKEFFEKVKTAEFTRMPVFSKEKNTFVGVVNVFFVLSHSSAPEEETIGQFMRPPLFVHANVPVDEILPRMRRSRQPLCLVEEDDNHIVGLVTTEDILEEIVGNL